MEIKKYRLKIKKLKFETNKEKRKLRKKYLIKLGVLFLILELLEEEQEKILGYIKSEFDKKKYYEYYYQGEVLSKKIKKSKPVDKKIIWKMIRKAALLEKMRIDGENPRVLFGFLSRYLDYSEEDKNVFYKIGERIFQKKKLVTDEMKLSLLKISLEKRINLEMILKNYKKNIHNLDYVTYTQILDKIKR